MKDFVKWLGVNEKVAKVAVWMLIIMVFLIAINAAIDSIGFSNYKITYDNLIKIDSTKIIDYIISTLICILNFYAIVLLVFKVKEYKSILKYALLYVAFNFIILNIFNDCIQQIFIIIYCIIFCYLYSGKQKKYALYGLIAVIIDVVIQGIWYIIKAKFVDYSMLREPTRALLSLDYFIIIAIIIVVKEIYLKKRGEIK